MNVWFTLLYQPLVNILILFYKLTLGNLGLAIILMTVFIRFVLLPLTIPSLKASEEMKGLAPELNKLKKKFKDDKKGFAQAQLELYKQRGINPAAGCLPQIVQIVVLIALFQAFNQVLKADGNLIDNLNKILYPFLQLSPTLNLSTKFFYLDLTKPDFISLPFVINLQFLKITKLPGIFLIASAISQYLYSKQMMPSALQAEKKAEESQGKEDDFASMMQKQMLYMMPLMTLFIGLSFPSGLVLYWLVFSLFMFVQRFFIKPNSLASKKNDLR